MRSATTRPRCWATSTPASRSSRSGWSWSRTATRSGRCRTRRTGDRPDPARSGRGRAHLHPGARRRGAGAARRDLLRGPGRLRRDRGVLGVGQVHAAEPARRARPAHRRPRALRRARRAGAVRSTARRAAQQPHRVRVPVVPPAAAADRVGQRHAAARLPPGDQARASRAGRGGARGGGARRPHDPPSHRAVGWPAAAGRDRTGAGDRSRAGAGRRADGQPRHHHGRGHHGPAGVDPGRAGHRAGGHHPRDRDRPARDADDRAARRGHRRRGGAVSTAEAFRVAMQALLANRLRSALTTLGVLIGVMSVVLLVAIGQGARAEITGAIEGLGSNLLFVLPGDGEFGAGPSRGEFNVDDIERVDQALPGGQGRAAGYLVSAEAIQADGERLTSTVFGVSEHYLNVQERTMARGQFFSPSDVATGRRVAVLGATTAESLFGAQDPIGRTVSLGAIRYRVSGVLERVGTAAFGPDVDQQVLIPISAAQRLFGTNRVDAIFVRASSNASIEDDRAATEAALAERLDPDSFSVVTQDEIIGVVGDILSILTWFLAAIAGISLLVGGVGVSNIMLVSVSERTREIGLRMALGARTRDITRQFLFEAVMLTGLGGGVGLVLGIAGAELAAVISPVPAEVTWWSIALALGVSVGVGLVFGVLPARRAGQLDPVAALRHE